MSAAKSFIVRIEGCQVFPLNIQFLGVGAFVEVVMLVVRGV
jgi:hypothetical protein